MSPTSTYDPILTSEPVGLLRLFRPLASPHPSAALVLETKHGGQLRVFRHGERVPSARIGTYRHRYLVDLTEHRLELEIPLVSQDPNFAWPSLVGLTCWVGEPDQVVARGIRNVYDALYDHMKWLLRRVSRGYDIAEFHEAEEALNEAVEGFGGDAALRLRRVHVELIINENEASSSGLHFRNLERDTRLRGMARQRHLDMMRRDGVEGLIAEIVEEKGPEAALEWISKAEETERVRLMEALKLVLDKTDNDREPIDIARMERQAFVAASGEIGTAFGGMRSTGAHRAARGLGAAAPLDGSEVRDQEQPRPPPPREDESPFWDGEGPPEDEPMGPRGTSGGGG